MRNVSLILAALLLTSPAWARVDIILERTDTNEVTVSYKLTGEPNLVRAFALDIVADEVNIVDVNDNINGYYYIYPGSIQITGNQVDDWGTAVADSSYPGTLPGLDSNGVTIEMGALYTPTDDSSPNAPPTEGVLLKLYVNSEKGCLTVTENETRGGIVLTDPTVTPDVNLPGGLCFGPPVPPCWNYDCFACGDSNGDCLITSTDVLAVINAWPPKPYLPCADYSKDGLITSSDVLVLVNHWPPHEACPQAEGCGPCTPVSP